MTGENRSEVETFGQKHYITLVKGESWRSGVVVVEYCIPKSPLCFVGLRHSSVTETDGSFNYFSSTFLSIVFFSFFFSKGKKTKSETKTTKRKAHNWLFSRFRYTVSSAMPKAKLQLLQSRSAPHIGAVPESERFNAELDAAAITKNRQPWPSYLWIEFDSLNESYYIAF